MSHHILLKYMDIYVYNNSLQKHSNGVATKQTSRSIFRKGILRIISHRIKTKEIKCFS